ncbi:Roundabout-like protein 3 isoform X4 [Aix galericulata]|nr:Roundabout-like protein 3 isoform X4 [Aix galericulata]
MVRRPAFIAGIGGACWLVLAGFGAWLYGRRRRRKELSHFTASISLCTHLSAHPSFGAWQPQVIARPTGNCSPPGDAPSALCPHRAAVGGHPWLVDAWCGGGTSSLDTAERYYNEAGISRYIAQTEPFGAGATEGPIYSSIEVGSEELRTFHRPCSQHGLEPLATLYAHLASGCPEHGKNLGKAVQTPMLSWTELLPPPPSASELSQYVEEEEVKKEEEEEEEVVEEEDEEGSLGLEDRCPLGEDVLQPAASSPATPAGCWSPAVLAPAPREDICSPHRFDSPRLPRRPPHGAGPPPSSPLSPCGPDTSEGHMPRAHRPHGIGKTRSETLKSRPKPKGSRYRREQHLGGEWVSGGWQGPPVALRPRSLPAADLPPPPLPPPGETPSQEPSGAERKAAHRPPRQGDIVPYSKPSFLAHGCSTTGSASSRGSTSSRGHGSGRSRHPDPLSPCPPHEER